MTGIRAGDEVRIFKRNRYHPDPEGGTPGTVTKVGRTYATAAYEYETKDWRGQPERRETTVEFNMETGEEKGTRYRSGIRVVTPAQLEAEAREEAAVAALKDAGFEIRMGHHPSAALIEALAGVAKTFAVDAAAL